MDEITLQLNSSLTEEQWDTITDVDFDHTDRITFHTKHGKEVDFVKLKPINTNADKYFRNATDEEIASFLAAVNNHRQWSEQTLMQDLDADYAYYLEWLKEEVNE